MHISQLNTCSLFFYSYRIWSVGRSGGHRGGLHILLHTGMWRVSFSFYSTCFAKLEFQVVMCRSMTTQIYSFSLGFSQYNIFARNIWSLDMDCKWKFPFIWTTAQVPCFYLLIHYYSSQNLVDALVWYLSTETCDNGLLTIDTGDNYVTDIKTWCCLVVDTGSLQQCKFMQSLKIKQLKG